MHYFSDIENNNKYFSGFVSVIKNRSAFASNDRLEIIDNNNTVLQSTEYTTETINGVTPFCGKL